MIHSFQLLPDSKTCVNVSSTLSELRCQREINWHFRIAYLADVLLLFGLAVVRKNGVVPVLHVDDGSGFGCLLKAPVIELLVQEIGESNVVCLVPSSSPFPVTVVRIII
jgi:hypothetical protein